MSQAEDLLNGLSGEELAQYSIVLEEHIVIDNKRNITVPESLKRIAVQHDHKIETVTFDCPRYWDDNDLSTMNIYISYSRSDKALGVYLADNVRISDEDENIIHFDWKIGDEISTVNGKLRFSVAAKKITDDEEIRWYSEINNQMFVSEGLDGSTVIPSGHPDIINDLLTRMDTIIAADTPLLDTSLSQNGLAADAGVTGTILNKKPYYAGNVSVMTTDTSLKVGDTVVTLGYYSINDGGGASYFIREKINEDEEDKGSIHFLNNGLVAELIITDSVNVKQFGAKGDGVTDDTIAIQNSINRMIKEYSDGKSGSSMLRISNGIYIVSSKINVYPEKLHDTSTNNAFSFKIIGDGRTSTQIHFNRN